MLLRRFFLVGLLLWVQENLAADEKPKKTWDTPGRIKPLSHRSVLGIPQVKYFVESRPIEQCKNGLIVNFGEGLGVNPQMLVLTSQQSLADSTVGGFLNCLLSAGSLDRASDLLTGFATSRLIGQFVGRQFDRGNGEQFWNMIPRNMWEGVCESYDLSHKLDFDPQWAFCNIVNVAGAAMTCKTPVDYSPARKTKFPTNVTSFNATEELNCPDLPVGSILNTTSVLSLSLRLMPYKLEYEEQPAARPEKLSTPYGLSVTPSFLRELAANEAELYLTLFLAIKVNLRDQLNHVGKVYAFGEENVAPGWVRVMEFTATQESERSHEVNDNNQIPVASLHRRRNPHYDPADQSSRSGGGPYLCEFLLISRETVTEFDWKLDFAAQMDAVAGLKEGILVHRGFNVISEAIFSPLVSFLNKEIFTSNSALSSCAVSATHFTLTGHSLGGALSAVLTVKLVSIYPGLKVDTVTFAAPRAFNQAGADFFSGSANIRTITNVMDSIPQFPCSNVRGQKRCGMRRYIHLEGFGEDPTYANYPNRVEIDLNAYYSMWPKFRGKSAANPLELTLGMERLGRLDVFHTDVYYCYLMRTACDSATVCPSFT